MKALKAVAATFLVSALLTAPAGAQIVDELSRRQALQLYRIGQQLLVAEQFEKAEEQFAKAVELDPLLTLAHYGRGQALMALRRYASAVQALRRCREAYEQIASLRQRDAAESDRLQREEINELRESVARVRTGQIRGAGPALLQRLEARLEDLERTRATSVGRLHTPAEVSLALGSASFRNGQIEEAEEQWKAAVVVNPRFGEALNNLAALYAITGRKKQAEDAVRAAERSGFRVNPQLKDDIRQMAAN